MKPDLGEIHWLVVSLCDHSSFLSSLTILWLNPVTNKSFLGTSICLLPLQCACVVWHLLAGCTTQCSCYYIVKLREGANQTFPGCICLTLMHVFHPINMLWLQLPSLTEHSSFFLYIYTQTKLSCGLAVKKWDSHYWLCIRFVYKRQGILIIDIYSGRSNAGNVFITKSRMSSRLRGAMDWCTGFPLIKQAKQDFALTQTENTN